LGALAEALGLTGLGDGFLVAPEVVLPEVVLEEAAEFPTEFPTDDAPLVAGFADAPVAVVDGEAGGTFFLTTAARGFGCAPCAAVALSFDALTFDPPGPGVTLALSTAAKSPDFWTPGFCPAGVCPAFAASASGFGGTVGRRSARMSTARTCSV
jgi:hypothetical protein